MPQLMGYTVTALTDPRDNLFLSDPDAFDIVIVDQTLPKLTGFDLACRIIQIRPDIPVLLGKQALAEAIRRALNHQSEAHPEYS